MKKKCFSFEINNSREWWYYCVLFNVTSYNKFDGYVLGSFFERRTHLKIRWQPRFRVPINMWQGMIIYLSASCWEDDYYVSRTHESTRMIIWDDACKSFKDVYVLDIVNCSASFGRVYFITTLLIVYDFSLLTFWNQSMCSR